MHLATVAIIAANVLVSMKGFKDYSFFEKYKFNIGAILRGEQFRMIRETARRMLTQAFAAEILETVTPPALQSYLASHVSGRLSPAVPPGAAA